MTIDPQIRDRLHAAVDDDAVPAGLAQLVVRRGRRRRARRYAVAGLAATLVLGAASAAVLLPDAPKRASTDVADAPRSALAWARSLPEGPPVDFPIIDQDGLHVGGAVVPVPENVVRSPSMPPQRAVGGWVVVLGVAAKLEPALLSSDGSLRELPAYQYPRNSNDPTVVVSEDGTQVAYGDQVVDLGTGDTTAIPKQRNEVVRLIDFTWDGLVYQLTAARGGDPATWLLRADGTTAQIALPEGAHLTPSRPADVALSYPESEDECLVSWMLVEGEWVERAPGCGDRAPGETADVSPDGRWVITEDLPDVWDLVDGGFRSVEVPRDTWKAWGYPLFGFAGWESPNTFVFPGMDPPDSLSDTENSSVAVQLVRCTLPTGGCERAGKELVMEPTQAPALDLGAF